MTRNEVLHKVIEIINEHKSADSPEATENSRLAEVLGLDSLDRVETYFYITKRLNFYFDQHDELMFDSKTVKDLVDGVCKKLNIPVIDVQKKEEKPKQQIVVQNPEVEKLKGVDLSKLAGKPVQLNGYEIVVKKIAETQQNKR